MLQIVSVRKRVGGLKLEDLPGLEALQIPGVASIDPPETFILIILEILFFDEAMASCHENQL